MAVPRFPARRFTRAFFAASLSLLPLPFVSTPAQAQERPTLKVEDYKKWESLGGATLSPDGKWFAYGIQRVDGSYELRYRHSGEPADEKVIASANAPAFSASSRYLAYSMGFSEDEREKRQKANQPLQNKLGLIDLTTGQATTFDDIAGFAFSEAGDYLALRGYPIKGRQSKGADLVVRDLARGTDTNFGNAAAFAWQNKGNLLALTIDAENKVGNGVQLFNPQAGTLKTLDSTNQGTYTNLKWRPKSDDLAVLRSIVKDEYEKPGYALVALRGLAKDGWRKQIYTPNDDAAFPTGMRITEAGLTWQEQGEAVFFGIADWKKKANAPQPTEKSKPGDAPKPDAVKPDVPKPANPAPPKPNATPPAEIAGVEIWHARDTDIMPTQKKTADADRQRSDQAVWWLDANQFVRLTKNRYESVALTRNGHFGALLDSQPYLKDQMFAYDRADIYRIDTATGARTPVQKNIVTAHIVSPWLRGASQTLLYVNNREVMAVDLVSGATSNLTHRISAQFIDDDPQDYGGPVKFLFGVGGWTKDDKTVFLYDKYDIWEVKIDGTGSTRLTDGAKEKIEHRLVSNLDPDAESVDRTKPVYVNLSGETSKWNGLARLDYDNRLTRLVWQNEGIGRLTKAKDANTFAFTREDAAASPNWFVTQADFAQPKPVSATNPQQVQFAWTHSEIVDFKNRQGKPLQGALYYPANYVPGKQYPMIVYIYEKLSDGVHNYASPSERYPYSVGAFTQAGYFVLMPDIVYRAKNPGLSAVDCVVPAVETVVRTGKVDPRRVGLVGHSWGAYQTAFIVTRTNVFAAGVAGAPLTDLVSMYLSVYWNSGGTDARIFEISQGRMAGPPWDAMKEYTANSPLFNLKTLNTPLLVAFGNQDGAVDWHQGIELYNAARRTGKQMVMLVYDGENHGLAKKPNQIDYHNRILEWFGHYLKGDKAEAWITSGKTFLEREEEIARQQNPAKTE